MSHTLTSMKLLKGEKKSKKQTLIVENESLEFTEQCRPDYFIKAKIVEERSLESLEQDGEIHLSEVEIFYNAQDKLHAAIEQKTIDSVKDNVDLIKSTEQCNNEYFSNERSFKSIGNEREDGFTKVGIYHDTEGKSHETIEWEIGDSFENEMEIHKIPIRPNESNIFTTKKEHEAKDPSLKNGTQKDAIGKQSRKKDLYVNNTNFIVIRFRSPKVRKYQGLQWHTKKEVKIPSRTNI